MIRSNLAAYKRYQVFLNYPFDENYAPLANALHFAVVAAGLLPVCTDGLSSPDRPRLDTIINAILNCHYSVHDFSRNRGEGDTNFARFNMPIEMGMGIFHALETQRREHRCAFFVPTPHEYQIFASDLSGLDPKCHYNDENRVVSLMYEWLRDVVPPTMFNSEPTTTVKEKYVYFKSQLLKLNGSEENGKPAYSEVVELMYQICSECDWWDWRSTKAGKIEFPIIPLLWKK